jgi:hypothetical protein
MFRTGDRGRGPREGWKGSKVWKGGNIWNAGQGVSADSESGRTAVGKLMQPSALSHHYAAADRAYIGENTLLQRGENGLFDRRDAGRALNV